MRLTTSALGILLLNPIGCSGTPQETAGTGGTLAATGGSGGTVHCNPQNTTACAVGQICKQTMFPIMPPQGLDGGMSDTSYLYECVPAGTGGASSTGGASGSGGLNDGGATTLGTKKAAVIMPRHDSTNEQDNWWSIAEVALRKT